MKAFYSSALKGLDNIAWGNAPGRKNILVYRPNEFVEKIEFLFSDEMENSSILIEYAFHYSAWEILFLFISAFCQTDFPDSIASPGRCPGL
ncbi:MAG: hypothetical protein WAO52_10845 [Prolixibacteraceae bacterium]